MKKLKKVFIVLVIAAAATLVFGSVVMGLWNAVLPAVLGVKAITFVQALGILVLSKILFGGFGPRGRGGFGKGHMLREKWAGMSPEERENFKSRLKARWK